MTEEEKESFKSEIIDYVKYVYSLILNEYEDYLDDNQVNFINTFNYDNDIVIDNGGRFSKGPGRWEKSTNKLHLSPELFNENTYKKGMEQEVEKLPLEPILEKLKHSADETFTGVEIANLVRQKNLSYLDITKGVIVHELFHSLINMKRGEEIFSVDYEGKIYDCKGVTGELLDEGLVEYLARLLSNKYDLFMFPSLPYQVNVDYAKIVLKKLGKNAFKIIFKGDYKTVLNYIHEPGLLESYRRFEYDWLQPRIIERLKIAESKEDLYVFGEVEELDLY